MTVDGSTEVAVELREFVERSARLLDEQRFIDWLELFAPDGQYGVLNYANEIGQGLFLVHDHNYAAIKQRVAQLKGIWHNPRAKTTHMLSSFRVVEADTEAGTAQTATNFTVYRTRTDEETELYALGHILDTFTRIDGEWKYAEHRAILDAEILPPSFAELI